MSLVDYNILRIIGKGSYGEVHLVTHKKDRKQYVIKKMFVNASAKERKAAEQEAKLLSALRHPNIVSYKDSFESDTGHLYIVMGYAEGGDLYTKLRELREKNERLSEQQTVRWYIQICMALQYLHDKRILHRDLKTQNIFLTKTRIIKVGDLGIARVLESGNDMATTLIGTPYYMSPELFANKPYNQKSDVWALGCCMYEMVTLKHAFNAKDINSLMYKILKGKMPPMPSDYSESLTNLIKDMLNPDPGKRPSVNRILRNPYIKTHIQKFLEESNKRRRPQSERSSRKTSTGSTSSRPASSRKTSSNSQGSSPSPHPPSLAPDPWKPSRQARAKSPTVITPPPDKIKDKTPPLSMQNKITDATKKTECISISNDKPTDNYKLSPKNTDSRPRSTPSRLVQNENSSNNAVHDSGVFVNCNEAPKMLRVEVHEPKQSVKASRPFSAGDENKTGRPLPQCPKVVDEPIKKAASLHSDLGATGDSDISVASSVPNSNGQSTSARQRRRERKKKETPKTPAIVDEIRKSRSTGFKQKIHASKMGRATKHEEVKKPSPELKSQNDENSNPVELMNEKSDRLASASSVEEPQRGQPDVEEFMTMLQTTLHLGSDKGAKSNDDGDSPLLEEHQDVLRGDLSPVPELSESSSSSATSNSRPFASNTPAATPVTHVAPNMRRPNPVTAGTLRSTQRLMDRIVSLRKDCISGLGVSVLHRAYEILDATENDDLLAEKLTALLGPQRFDQWSGKIWQLKYCEESLFGHCGTITAF